MEKNILREISDWKKEGNTICHDFIYSNENDKRKAKDIVDRFARNHKEYFITHESSSSFRLCKENG